MYYYFKGALVYFWLVLLLFQEATYSDLVISRVLCVLETSTFFKSIELIDHSSCSHSFDELPYFYYEESVTVAHSFKITVFFRTGVVARDIIVTSCNTSLVSGMYILKDVIWRNQFQPFIFFLLYAYMKHIIILLSKGQYFFCNTYGSYPLWQVVSGLFKQIWKVLCLYEESNCSHTFWRCLFIPQN